MTSLKRSVFLFSYVPILAWSVAKADAPGVRLVRQASNDRINVIDEQLHQPMKWSHGGYFVVDRLGGQPPVFYTLNRDGNWTDTAQFQNPEPNRFASYSYDRQSDGTVVFSGATYTDPHALSPFLALTSSDGKIQHLLHLQHYFPFQLAVAPDDTIWTLGFEIVNESFYDPAVNQEAHVLRHFDKAGNLIASAFPQSQFNQYQRFCITTGLFVVTRDRLGWYGSPGARATYTEVSLDTMSMKAYPGVPSNSKYPKTAGLAMTNGGVASVSIEEARELTNYILDRTSSKWLPISVPPMGGYNFTPKLIGSDGDNLVFKNGSEAGFFTVLQ